MLSSVCRERPCGASLHAGTELVWKHSQLIRSLVVQLRMERFTLYWIDSEVTIEAGALLAVGSGAHIYGGVDWVSMAMSADETADLTKPEVKP